MFFIFPPTKEDNKLALSESVNVDGWSKAKIQRTVSYIVKNDNPKYEVIVNDRTLFNRNFDENKKDLTKKDIIKLHHFFGHCTAERLDKLIQKAGKWRP